MKRIILSAAVCAFFGIAGCKQNTQPGVNSIAKKVQGGGIPFIQGSSGLNYAGTFQVDNTVGHDVDSFESSASEALVYLWDTSSSVPVSGGTVTVNGTSIPTMDHSADGNGVYYMANSANGQTVPMAYDGSKLIFSVAGNSNWAALKDTISYTNKQMSLSAPGIADTLSASSGFTISWPYNTGSTDTVVVQLIGDTSYYVASTSDNGSYTVTPAMLSGFSTGSTLKVLVTRITYKYATASDGRVYVMGCYSREDDEHPLKP